MTDSTSEEEWQQSYNDLWPLTLGSATQCQKPTRVNDNSQKR